MKRLISVPTNVVPYFHQIAELDSDNWFVSSDPQNKKVGSGGGTAHILSELFKKEKGADFPSWIQKEKKVIIHAGGQSRRLPAYAPIGKSLLPMPVFRWSRGQHLNQRLVHLQAPLFEQLINQAPKNINTLIASGDTLIFKGEELPRIPDVDVVCFGLWLEPEKATNHGVFFSKHESPDKLEFMLQKPPIHKIRNLIQNYYFLMDIGIWMLSDKAVTILMQKCGWTGNGFINSIADNYDLYSEFGLSLGNEPTTYNEEINQLSVALINLDGGEFYHLGNSSELVSSNLNIQNRIHDQREIWHKNVKPHQSIFVLNSETNNNFTVANQNIWIENSVIPDRWKLLSDHVFTGIPKNQWHLNPEPGCCLDVIPVNESEIIVRNYGFTDSFRGKQKSPETSFMNVPLMEWLKKRNLTTCISGDGDSDIFELPLFPILDKTNIEPGFIQWLWDKDPEHNETYTKLWKEKKRVSSQAVSDYCSINLLEQKRKEHRLNNYSLLAKNYNHSVFYQLDLQKTANDFFNHKLELPVEIDNTSNGWISIHDNMFRACFKRMVGHDWTEQENKAFSSLQKQIVNYYKNHVVEPRINLLPDQIAWGRSPVRLDLAGGWTDTPPYCFLYGGKVVNVAVELNGQPPLHCYIKGSTKPEIVLRSIDLGDREILNSFEDIRSYENIQSAFSIPKAALALSGFLPEFSKIKYNTLQEQLKAIGGGLEISILSAVPKGSGLGTSSILAATVLGTINNVCCLNWDKQEIGKRTLALEQLLTTGGGWQDQYGGLLEGIKLLETAPGIQQDPQTKWLPDSLFSDPEYKSRILLYYTGITRIAKSILADIVRGMFLNSSEHLSILSNLKRHALNTYNVLLKKDFEGFSEMIDRSWQLNQNIDAGTNTPEIQELINRIAPYTAAQKLLGAGGGGFMLIIAKSKESATILKNELTEKPVNQRGRFVDFEISDTGFRVTKS